MGNSRSCFDDWLADQLDELDRQGLRRRRQVVERSRPGWIRVDGRDYVDFASNDYLGLACDPAIKAAARRFLAAEGGFGSTASPLVTGYHPQFASLERELAHLMSAPAALVLGSGFVANSTILCAFIGSEDAVFVDKRDHASLIDGARASGAKLVVYRTDRLEDLERRLRAARSYRRRWIVTDSVFSMDGDVAPLADLCELADRNDALLYVDEAHAVGVLGEIGGGLADQLRLTDRVPFRLGTLGKALGSVGGFLAASQPAIDWLVQKARGYVYSTSLPPVAAAVAREALARMVGEPERRSRLQANVQHLREGLADLGLAVVHAPTAIVPLTVGQPQRAIELASFLRDRGLWTVAIRPPTVPVGTARVRITLSAAHDSDQIQNLLSAIRKFFQG